MVCTLSEVEQLWIMKNSNCGNAEEEERRGYVELIVRVKEPGSQGYRWVIYMFIDAPRMMAKDGLEDEQKEEKLHTSTRESRGACGSLEPRVCMEKGVITESSLI